MSYIGIDVGNNSLHCARFVYKGPGEYACERLQLPGRASIPFSLLYDPANGPVVADTITSSSFQANFFPHLGNFLLKSEAEILEENRSKSTKHKIKINKEAVSPVSEIPIFIVNMNNSPVEKSVTEIICDYFVCLFQKSIVVNEKPIQGPISAVLSLNKVYKQPGQKLLVGSLYKAGFKVIKVVPNDVSGLIGGLDNQLSLLNQASCNVLVNFGRSELNLSVVKYQDGDFEILEKEYIRSIGGAKIDQDVKEVG